MSENNEQNQSQYWLDIEVDKILKAKPAGEITVASGHSPSGKYHVGTIREIITANAIDFTLRQAGRASTHIDFVDDFDVLRKIPADLPREFEQYLGMPLYAAPSPREGYSYADYYLEMITESCQQLGVHPELLRSHTYYQAGKFIPYIEQVLENLEQVKEIIQRVSNRQLPEGWVPVQLLSDDDFLNTWTFKNWDKQNRTIIYADEYGAEGELDYVSQPGRVKMDWRLDWPARWHLLGVDVEPFGRDHAARGGSYDTGKELVETIFSGQPPHPIAYEFINIAGQNKKMSKSAGDTVTVSDALDIMPPEVLRYFVIKSRPNKKLFFDPGEGLYKLIDEYSKLKHQYARTGNCEFKEAYLFATQVNRDSYESEMIANIPFNHLVTVYQAAAGDVALAHGLLKRTGYETEQLHDFSVLEREFEFIHAWLERYAPESVKFELQEELPDVELSEKQKAFLRELADALATNPELDAETVHQIIHELRENHTLQPHDAFQAIYRILLGQDSGPKAGWYLTTIDKDWLVRRLRLEA